MSFLLSIQSKKTKLKPTETVVTHQDGQKYLESNSNLTKLDECSSGYVIDTKPDDTPANIIAHLFLGSQDCCDKVVLEKYDIKHVLSVGIEAPQKYPNITYKFVEILDLPETKLDKHLSECIEFIEVCLCSQENVLVHCNAGVSRSASIVIGFLMLKRNLTFEEAYALVKKVRECVKPNDGFDKQLRNLKRY